MTSPFQQAHNQIQEERMKEIHDGKQRPTSDERALRLMAEGSDTTVVPSSPLSPTEDVITVVPAVHPDVIPPSNPTATMTSKTDLDKIIDIPNGPRLGAQIKLDVGRVSGQVSDSGLRSLIGGYQRVVSPHFESDGDSHFPRSHKPHTTFSHRSSMDGFGNVLLFHIGAAILAYYKIVRKEATGRDMADINRLHRIAERGATSFKPIGTDFKGYSLEPMVDMR